MEWHVTDITKSHCHLHIYKYHPEDASRQTESFLWKIKIYWLLHSRAQTRKDCSLFHTNLRHKVFQSFSFKCVRVNFHWMNNRLSGYSDSLKPHTCVPNILHPHICARSKKQPMHWDEKQTDHIWCQCYTDEKHWKGLQTSIAIMINWLIQYMALTWTIYNCKIKFFCHNVLYLPSLDTWMSRKRCGGVSKTATNIQIWIQGGSPQGAPEPIAPRISGTAKSWKSNELTIIWHNMQERITHEFYRLTTH